MKNNAVRVRFAPSPTGHLHIGGVRTALFNYLFAKHNNGTFLLRIEDTDTSRSTEESIQQIIEGLKWIGIEWNEGPFRQTERKKIYQSYLKKLLNEGKAYKCYCSSENLREIREKAMAAGENPRYNRKCRDLSEHPKEKPFVVRFRTPVDGSVTIKDLLHGEVTFNMSEMDDIILARSDGSPTYNFVVVVDDVEMEITHVIRGDDHLSNTPKQALLYQGLNLPFPEFIHIPMILGKDKKRLSKRHGATSILAYKDMGYLSEAMINYLVRLGWSSGDQEIFSKKEMIEKFTLENINKSAGVFDTDKSLWLNQHYIKESRPSDISPLLKKFLVLENIISTENDFADNEIEKVIPSLQERSKTLIEMAHKAEFYFKEEIVYNEAAAKKYLKTDILLIFKEFEDKLIAIYDALSYENLEPIFDELMKNHNLKLGKIAQPLRVALTGLKESPGIFEVIVLLGKDKVLKRLQKAIEYIQP
ncbi:MAG TPA: glutamate--tRNA ligase [Nitrospinota bacterium]|jgi:glutamyl-tRNA synthetase|nr:glutamate--tRNA ligase [Nitrospinota bacterium]|tara:strand:- start:859 stop:2280 length:1422 start_codon:yes stop_codon:yes gene_type:complete